MPVYDSAEAEVGTLRKVLDNARERIFDGIEVDRRDGVRVFVDAPEVARTAERGVTLNITGAELDAYPAVKSADPGGCSVADQDRGADMAEESTQDSEQRLGSHRQATR